MLVDTSLATWKINIELNCWKEGNELMLTPNLKFHDQIFHAHPRKLEAYFGRTFLQVNHLA